MDVIDEINYFESQGYQQFDSNTLLFTNRTNYIYCIDFNNKINNYILFKKPTKEKLIKCGHTYVNDTFEQYIIGIKNFASSYHSGKRYKEFMCYGNIEILNIYFRKEKMKSILKNKQRKL